MWKVTTLELGHKNNIAQWIWEHELNNTAQHEIARYFFRLKVAFHQYQGTSLSHEMRFFHYSQMVRLLHLSFSICTSSKWPLALVWYLLRQENGTYFPFCNIYVLSGRFPEYSVATLLSSWNLTRTTGQDTAAGDNKTAIKCNCTPC